MNPKSNTSIKILKENNSNEKLYLETELIQRSLSDILKEKKSMSFKFKFNSK